MNFLVQAGEKGKGKKQNLMVLRIAVIALVKEENP
jgi:hypothetical protein